MNPRHPHQLPRPLPWTLLLALVACGGSAGSSSPPAPVSVTMHYVDNAAGTGSNVVARRRNVLFYFTGLSVVPELARPWAP